MGHPGRLSVGLAATATLVLLVLLGVAAYTLPAHFDDGGTAPAASQGTQAMPALQPAAAQPARPSAAVPTVGSLISATFSQLPQAQSAPAAVAATAAATSAAPVGAAPAMHVVKTTTIRVGDTPAQQPVPLAMADSQAAAAPAMIAAGPQPATAVASVAPDDAAPVPMGPPSKAVQAKAAEVAKDEPAHDGSHMKVGGSGVSVRAGPSKSKSVLFNLAAGQKVTVGARQRGWLQVTDAQGRSGWAYSELLRKI